MPNWCDNQVTITGPNSVIDKIEKIVKEESNDIENGLLQFFHPMPKELMETEKSSDYKKMKKQPVVDGFNNWYDWRVENWSTKWELCEFYGVDRQYLTEQSEGESIISFGFTSAWAPPLGAYEKFLADNEDCSLKAYYYEGGCDFMGEWDNGSDNCYPVSDYKSDSDFWNDGIGSTLDDVFNITESMAEYEAEQEQERLNEDVYKYSKGKKVNIGEEI
tara:strand:+ start:103 stop:756 length:654 start_codon:yes stop_codon:yes gene_type:complete